MDHVRRLVNNPGAVYGGAVNPLFQISVEPLQYRFTRESWGQWIPNTDELHYLGQIELSGGLVRDGQTWILDTAGAVDWNRDQVAEGNIARNTGTSFVLSALAAPRKETGVAHTPGPDSVDIATITATSTGQGFEVELLHKDEYRLVVKSGRLAIEGKREYGQAGLFWDHWAIRALTGARPGDDLALSFVVGNDRTTQGPRLAVYDKKLLWRANLYIDEGSGGADWNDRHPWNAPLAQNDWNKKQDGSVSDGKQIPIVRFTSPRVQDNNDNVIRVNSVAYDYPENKSYNEPNDTMMSTDTPFAFNSKMATMKDDVGGYFDSQGSHPKVVGRWGSFYMPLGKWSKYQNVGTSINLVPSVGLFYHDRTPEKNYDGNLDSELKKGPDTIGTQMMSIFSSFNPGHIGTDCVGFVKNSIKYRNTSYAWATHATFRNYPNKEASFSSALTTKDDFDKAERLKTVIPGDIFYYGIDHVGIVLSTGENGAESEIRLIEAYFNGDVAYVDNSRFLIDLTQAQKPWAIVRLK